MKKDYGKKSIWMGEKGKAEKTEKRKLRQTRGIKEEKGLKNMESIEGVKWCKERKIGKQLKLKSKNILKWKLADEKADEKAAKFHP